MVLSRTMLCALSLGFVLVGCSSTGDFPAINSFTVTPNSLPPGGGTVMLAWNVAQATALSVDQDVGTVTPAGAGSTSVQVTSFTIFTLTATNSVGSSAATALVTVAGPVNVHGTVVDQMTQLPLAGVSAILSSGVFSQTAVTDTEGTFTVEDVPTPYNAVLLGGNDGFAVEFVGLTRSDPVFPELYGTPNAQFRSATMTGHITGGSYPESPNYMSAAVFVSPEATVGFDEGCVTSSYIRSCSVIAPDGSYSAQIQWFGPPVTTGSLYALQALVGESVLPVSYSGYGALGDLVIEDGLTLEDQNVHLTSVSTGTVQGTLSFPIGTRLIGTTVALLNSAKALIGLVFDDTGTKNFSYVVPSIENTSLLVAASVLAGDSESLVQKRVSATGAQLMLSVPSVPTLLAPANGATGISTTPSFSWSRFPGGIHIFTVYFDDYIVSNRGPYSALMVYTAADTLSLPDLADAGLALRPTSQYDWEVTGLAPVASIDALTSLGAIQALPLGDYAVADSATQWFATGP